MPRIPTIGEESPNDAAEQFRDVKLDPTTSEWVLLNGSPEFVTGLDAVAQALRCRLRLFLGEWAFDEEEGVAYLQKILGKNKPEHTQSEFARVVRGTPGVSAVQRIAVSYNRATRELSVAIAAMTILGQLNRTIKVPTT